MTSEKHSFSGNKILVNQPFIDSLSLKIPLSCVTVIDQRLTSETLVVYADTGEVETGETEDGTIDDIKHPPKPIIIKKTGITVRLSVANINIYNKETEEKVPTKFVNLTVSSKMLKEQYFEGINRSNIRKLYEEFMQFGVFKCSFDVFRSGIVSDVDIAINRYCSSLSVFSSILDSLYSQSGTKSKHLRPFGKSEKEKKEGNIGLSFSDRDNAKPSLPFIKFYHKQMELLHKSADFNEAYLYNYQYEIVGLTRVEATIKNYKHKKRLAKYDILPMFRNLDDLLALTVTEMHNFILFSLNAYIEQKPRIKAPNLSPTDHIIFELLQNCISKGYDYDSLINVVDSFKANTEGSEKVSKSRMRKKIRELFDLLIHKDVKIMSKQKHNSHVIEYLKFLGIRF